MTGDDASARPRWLAAVRRYLVAVAVGNLLWEAAQLPLYTLWRTEPVRSLVRAVLHCTAGDIVIAAVMLVIALVAVGNARWPNERLAAVVVVVVAAGVAYTIGSEYVNTIARRSWTYTEWMPTVPWLGTGLTPLAQWLFVPSLALAWATRLKRAQGQPLPTPPETGNARFSIAQHRCCTQQPYGN